MNETAANRLLPLAGACALAIAVLLIWVLPGSAQAASVVGPGGQISGCYKKGGKAKGTLRVVPPGKRCQKGEKRLNWSAQGPQGQTGGQGTTGGTGDSGLQSQINDLRTQVTELTSQLTDLVGQVNSLQGILSGVTNQELLDAIGATPLVNQLCTEVPELVDQLNSVRTVLNNLSLGGIIPVGLVLNVTGVPAALPAFACS